MPGLANPGPVAAALWTDAELESGVCLDAIVTVSAPLIQDVCLPGLGSQRSRLECGVCLVAIVTASAGDRQQVE